MPGMPGMGGMPGAPKRQIQRQQARKKRSGKGVSGNPAKRNAPQGQQAASASAFEMPADEAGMQAAMKDFQLPPDLQKLFNQQNKG